MKIIKVETKKAVLEEKGKQNVFVKFYDTLDYKQNDSVIDLMYSIKYENTIKIWSSIDLHLQDVKTSIIKFRMLTNKNEKRPYCYVIKNTEYDNDTIVQAIINLSVED